MHKRYPHDCSAACDKTAKWQFTYESALMPNRYEEMQACDEHKDEIRRAVVISARNGKYDEFPMEYTVEV